MTKSILLIRHAKVEIDDRQRIDSASLNAWVQSYDNACICTESLPSDETIALVQGTEFVLSSTLKRAIDSAKVLGVELAEKNPLFNEAAIPQINIPLLKFYPKTWLVILRLMLFVGLGQKETSLKVSKAQAQKASDRLDSLSQEYASIALVGHGAMNWLIGKALVQRGWEIESKEGHGNWSVTRLTKITKEAL